MTAEMLHVLQPVSQCYRRQSTSAGLCLEPYRDDSRNRFDLSRRHRSLDPECFTQELPPYESLVRPILPPCIPIYPQVDIFYPPEHKVRAEASAASPPSHQSLYACLESSSHLITSGLTDFHPRLINSRCGFLFFAAIYLLVQLTFT